MRWMFFGYAAPLLNVTLFGLKAYDAFVPLSSGTPLSSPDFINDLILCCLGFSLRVVLSWRVPVYESHYGLAREGMAIQRFLRGSKTILHRSILRSEIYVKEQPSSRSLGGPKIRQGLRRGPEAGRIYTISPEDPKVLVNRLRGRLPRLTVNLVELTSRGKRVREF